MGSTFSFSLSDLNDDASFSRAVGRNQVNVTPGLKSKPLRTTSATSEIPQRSITSWTASDIMQGAVALRPEGAQYDAFQQVTSQDLVGILNSEGNINELLGGRQAWAPYDVVARGQLGQSPNSDSFNGIVERAVNFDGAGGSNVRTEPSVDGQITVADVNNAAGGTTTVAQSIASQAQALFDAAKAAGLSLGGSGYRSHQRQIELRTINGCPDVWNSPASSCRVPTARPGRSNHEKGLAIDFTENGSSLKRSFKSFNWMKTNASKYGFINLPSEPWHWSVDGK